MPIFEFVCRSCGHRFEELFFRSADADTVTCPTCGGEQVERQLSPPAAQPTTQRTARGGRCGPVG
jgi:putative FmdB family regulatory protein